MKNWSPTGSVRFSFCSRRMLAIANSLKTPTNANSPTTASTGLASGRITPQKIWEGVAPSTRADSSSSCGIESKNPFINHVCTPRVSPR